MQVARRNLVSVGLVAAVVGLAFADSSIVVLALPQLYGQFHTSIEGVSWVLTAYNVAVAVASLALVLFVHRVNGKLVLAVEVGLAHPHGVCCTELRCGFRIPNSSNRIAARERPRHRTNCFCCNRSP